MINELIEQIGRERLLEMADFFGRPALPGEGQLLAHIALAVLDAQEKPALHVEFKDGWPVPEMLGLVTGFPPMTDGLHDFYTTPPAANVPSGWRLVPIDPTKDMLLASKRYKAKNKVPTGPGVYRAMLAAAPAPVGE